MSMFKKLGVVVASTLVAVSAMATNFRAADQVYVPIAGHASNGAGFLFVSDVTVSNLTSDSVAVSVIYSSGPSGTQTQFANLFTLGPNERKTFADFVGVQLGLTSGALGQLVFNGCLANSAGCGASTQDPNTGVSPNFRNISVESRIYSIPPGTVLANNPVTQGQLFSGYPWYNFVSQDQAANALDKVAIVGIRNDTAYRTNLGASNASQFSNTTIVFKLYATTASASPSPIAVKNIDLGPLGLTQQSVLQLFPSTTFTAGTYYYATVEQQNSSATSDAPASCTPGGCPGFFAWGSILDAHTETGGGDATTLEPQYLKALSDAQINCLYPAAGTSPCKGTPAMHRAAKH